MTYSTRYQNLERPSSTDWEKYRHRVEKQTNGTEQNLEMDPHIYGHKL